MEKGTASLHTVKILSLTSFDSVVYNQQEVSRERKPNTMVPVNCALGFGEICDDNRIDHTENIKTNELKCVKLLTDGSTS